jgi:hypothetical protein
VRDHVRFTAHQFAPIKPEDEQVNPGVYGEELARWLQERLQAAGYTVAEPGPEDWGWFLSVSRGGARFLVGCGNTAGSRTEWLAFAEPAVGLLARLLGRARADAAAHAALTHAIDAALRGEPGVAGVEWFQQDRRTGQETDHAPRPAG